MPIILQGGKKYLFAIYLLLLLAHLCLVRPPPSVTIYEIDAIEGARISKGEFIVSVE